MARQIVSIQYTMWHIIHIFLCWQADTFYTCGKWTVLMMSFVRYNILFKNKPIVSYLVKDNSDDDCI